MNPKPANNTLPRPTAALPEPFSDLLGNLQSKILLLNILCNTAINQDVGIIGHNKLDVINAVDLLRTEITEGINILQQNFSRL